MTTKEQERTALAKIKAIVEGLGENSYIGTALAGCFEKAEENIEYDAAFSLQDELETAEKEKVSLNSQLKGANLEIDRLTAENKKLEEQVDRLAEWEHVANMGTQLSQKDYEHLTSLGVGSRILTDDEAKGLIESEFGFSTEKIEIIREVKTYKSSKPLGGLCKVENTYNREPAYNATDWNYIRFNCADWYYEMIDGQLYKYYC